MEKRYDHIIRNQQARDLWKRHNVYATQQHLENTYTVDTPPPTVSGSLHIGHIFSYTQMDIIARYKRMTGHNVFYPFGFDGNGLPTERLAEKQHKTNAGKIGRQAFIDLCLQSVEQAQTEFVDLWKQIGISANFDNTYSTISPQVQKIAQESFIRLAKEGFMYQKEEPAMYCTTMRTSVAQADLETVEKETLFTDINFTAKDGTTLTISTTRPELLPSCVALIFHPDDSRYQHLKDSTAIVPIYGNEVPVLQDETVQIDKGTGLVMICTFGDKTDIEWYKKFKLPYKQSVGFDGRWTENTGPLAGLKVADARAKILELLEEQGCIVGQKKITHDVSVYERSKKEIEYVVLPQWFVNIMEHKKAFLQAVDDVQWHPKHMKSRCIDWINNLNWDWCVSRQRVYGIPFPVWYERDTGKAIFADIDQLPVNPETDKPASYQGNPDNLIPEKDVMDTWNTSSLTPYICKELFFNDGSNPFDDHQDFLPMSVRPQAHDIIRTWAFYTIVKTWMHEKRIPWNEIVISGYVLSEQKEKISKSKGNAPTEPHKLLELFAPDAVRFWTASGTLGQDIAFSPDQMKIGQKLQTKLWNAFKFCKMHLEEYSHNEQQPEDIGTINQWMLDATTACLTKYRTYLDSNEFGLALQTIESCFWSQFCDNYIEIIKDQFFNAQNYTDHERNMTRWTMYTVGLRILQMYAPYMPYITESLYQEVFTATQTIPSLHATQLPKETAPVSDTNNGHMDIILHIIGSVRRLKTEHQLALRTEIINITISCQDDVQHILEKNSGILRGICRAKEIQFDSVPATNLETIKENHHITINLL